MMAKQKTFDFKKEYDRREDRGLCTSFKREE